MHCPVANPVTCFASLRSHAMMALLLYFVVARVLRSPMMRAQNYYMYRSDVTGEWTRFPWDVKSCFGTDRGLGGQPAPDYCILACTQWNSPLYGDDNHPQVHSNGMTPESSSSGT